MSAVALGDDGARCLHVIGVSSPLTSASAPDGVDEMLMASVVPRVTEAQPPRVAQNARTPRNACTLPKPGNTQPQPEVKSKGSGPGRLKILNISCAGATPGWFHGGTSL